jgi:hypothetical protein
VPNAGYRPEEKRLYKVGRREPYDRLPPYVRHV